MRGPDIPAGTVCNELTGTIDILPTIAALTGEPLAGTNKIDGMDVSGLWKGTSKQSPRKEFLYYTSRGAIEGIRRDNWKLIVKKPRPRNARKPINPRQTNIEPPKVFLFNLAMDVGEQTNLAEVKPGVVNRLRARMEALDKEITKNSRKPWVKN